MLCLNRVKPLEVAAAQTSGLVNLVFSRQTVFFDYVHVLIDKPMVITEPAVASTRLLDLGSKLYPSNMQRILKKDLTQFMESLSRVRQNQASQERVYWQGEIQATWSYQFLASLTSF